MLTTAVGILVMLLWLVCWVGQTLVVFAPAIAVKLGVGEREEELDRSMYLFERYGQGVPDIALTWLLPASALMMLLGLGPVEYQHVRAGLSVDVSTTHIEGTGRIFPPPALRLLEMGATMSSQARLVGRKIRLRRPPAVILNRP